MISVIVSVFNDFTKMDWLNDYLFRSEKMGTICCAIKNIIKLKAFLRLVHDPGF